MSDEATLDDFSRDPASTSDSDWQSYSLGELAKYHNGRGFDKSEWSDTGYPIIRIQNLTDGGGDFNYFDGELSEEHLVTQNDILLSWSATIEVFEWRGGNAALNQHIFKVESGENVNHIFYRFKLEDLLPQLNALSQGSTMKHLRKPDLVNTETKMPPLPEQRKIATVLYTVDRAIEKTEEVIEQTRTVEKGLMQDLFREGVGKPKPETKELRRIGQVPKHWDVVKLGDICERITDGTHKSPPTIEEGYPYITSQNVRNWGFDLSDLKYISEEDHNRITGRCNPEEGDVLYVKDGSNTGNVNVNTLDFEFSLLSSVALIKPNRNRVKSWFLKYLLSWPKFRDLVLSQMSGTGIRRLTISKLEKTDVLLPPMEEQEHIIKMLDEYYTYRKKQTKNKNHLQRLKRGLMQDLLSGTVRTTDTNMEVPDKITQHG